MIKWRWLGSWFWLAVGSAILMALYQANDNIIMHDKIVYEAEPLWARSFYLMIGGWIGLLLTWLLNKLFGKKLIDPHYNGLILIPWLAQKHAIYSGGFAAVSTMLFLWASQDYDPSIIMILSAFSIVILACFDVKKNNATWQSLFCPALLILIGSFIASLKSDLGILNVSLKIFLIIFLGKGFADALDRWYRQKGGNVTDAANFVFWRLFWLSLTGSIGVIMMALWYDKLDVLFSIRTQLPGALIWIGITMTFVFGCNILCQLAFKYGAVSKVSLVLNLQILLGIPIALIGNTIKTGVFEDVPSDLFTWICRCLGSFTILSGIILLKLKPDKQEV